MEQPSRKRLGPSAGQVPEDLRGHLPEPLKDQEKMEKVSKKAAALQTQQQTLKSSFLLEGVGLHSGKKASVRVKPARANTGIIFLRTDVQPAVKIQAHFSQIVSTRLAMTLGNAQGGSSAQVATVEHLLAALQGLQIDNAEIEVSGPEVPILDGSSRLFVEAIEKVGIETQVEMKRWLLLKKKIEIQVAEKWAYAEPASELRLHGSIEWDHPAVGYQEFFYQEGQTDFTEVASARTFGFLKEVEGLKKMGLALGGSLDNSVVLDHALVVNPGGLRYPDELIRHKILDALGDLKLAGVSLKAAIRLHRSGHELHRQLLHKIFSDAENYELVTVGAPRVKSTLQMALLGSYAASF